MKLNQLEKSQQFIGLFAGRSGHGKSVAIASFAELGGVYVFDLDKRARGMLGVEGLIPKEWLDRIEIDQSIDIKNGYDAIDKKLEIFSIASKSNQLAYKTIVIESFGSLTKTFMFDSQRLRGEGGKFEGKVRGKVKFIHPDDYNYVSAGVSQIMFFYAMQLKCNFILSGWIVDRYGKDPTQSEYAPSVVIGQKMLGPQNLSEEVLGYFDEVYLFEKEETGISSQPLKYTVSFENSLAKTSNPLLHGKGKVDLTGKLFWRVYNELTKETSR